MQLVDTINVVESTTLSIPYSGEGIGSGEFTVEIEGPLSRIATSQQTVVVENGNGTIILEIEPQGLLQDNMYVLGTVHLQSFNGENWVIDIELKASENDDLPFIGNQAFVLTLFFAIFAFWFAMAIFSSGTKSEQRVNPVIHDDDEFLPGDHL